MKHSSSETKISKNILKEKTPEKNNDLLIKNAQLEKENKELKLLLKRMEEERIFYLSKIKEKDRSFLSENELNSIQRIKSDNESRINELKAELDKKNNENNELNKNIEQLKSESKNMSDLYEKLLAKMDKFIEVCGHL